MIFNILWFFYFLIVLSSLLMIFSNSPIHSIFVNVSIIFLLFNVDFLGLLILIVYVGTIAILFMVMILNMKQLNNSISLLIVLVFLLQLFYIIVSYSSNLLDSFNQSITLEWFIFYTQYSNSSFDNLSFLFIVGNISRSYSSKSKSNSSFTKGDYEDNLRKPTNKYQETIVNWVKQYKNKQAKKIVEQLPPDYVPLPVVKTPNDYINSCSELGYIHDLYKVVNINHNIIFIRKQNWDDITISNQWDHKKKITLNMKDFISNHINFFFEWKSIKKTFPHFCEMSLRKSNLKLKVKVEDFTFVSTEMVKQYNLNIGDQFIRCTDVDTFFKKGDFLIMVNGFFLVKDPFYLKKYK